LTAIVTSILSGVVANVAEVASGLTLTSYTGIYPLCLCTGAGVAGGHLGLEPLTTEERQLLVGLPHDTRSSGLQHGRCKTWALETPLRVREWGDRLTLDLTIHGLPAGEEGGETPHGVGLLPGGGPAEGVLSLHRLGGELWGRAYRSDRGC
jgi:hypothetical protein